MVVPYTKGSNSFDHYLQKNRNQHAVLQTIIQNSSQILRLKSMTPGPNWPGCFWAYVFVTRPVLKTWLFGPVHRTRPVLTVVVLLIPQNFLNKHKPYINEHMIHKHKQYININIIINCLNKKNKIVLKKKKLFILSTQPSTDSTPTFSFIRSTWRINC